uniref:ATPase_AAA_core domain-containing protein n=1 Tax=Rhabditophanes sp. KR3021 TaxID=114890 RepID=A0AC35U3B9_9BILA
MSKASKPKPLAAREKETAQIYDAVCYAIKHQSFCSMYISGKPGTGKSATMDIIAESLSKRKDIDVFTINCVSSHTKTALYNVISMKCMNTTFHCSQALKNIEIHFKERNKPLLLVLDEIDYLHGHNPLLLYIIYDWPTLFKGKVFVIGVANTLDLTHRMLPKLKGNEAPLTINFMPYTSNEIAMIINNTLIKEGDLDQAAIQLCSKRIAAQTGDVRSALTTARQCLRSGNVDSDEDNDEDNDEENEIVKDEPKTPAVKKSAYAKIFANLNSVSASPIVRTKIPNQPKIIMAIILKLSLKLKTPAITEAMLAKAYEKVQPILKAAPCNRFEIKDALSLLESQSYIRVKNGKYTLGVDAGAALKAIADHQMISEIEKLNI